MEILTLGSKIKNRRKELGLTLKELAGERVTPAQLSYVETDKCKPSLDLLEYISESLGLEMDYLLESEKKQVSNFCEYNIKVSKIEIMRQSYNEAKFRIEQVLYAALNYNLSYFAGEAEMYLGIIYQNLNDYDNAVKHYLNALQKFSKVDNHKRIIETYLQLGIAAYEKNYTVSSIGYLRQAEKFIEEVEHIDICLKLKLYFYIILSYQQFGDNDNLISYSNKLSDTIKLFNDKSKYGEQLLSIGKILEINRKYDKALEFINRSLSVYESLQNMKFISKVETDLGRILSSNELIDESFEHLNKALEIKKLVDDSTVPLTLMEIAQNYINRKEYDKTFDILNEILNISIKTGNREYESLAYYKLYKAFNQKGDYIKAEESIRRCADIFEDLSKYRELADCYLEMGEFYKSINREREAIEYVSRSIDIHQKLLTMSDGKTDS